MSESNWDAVQDEWDEYDVSDLEGQPESQPEPQKTIRTGEAGNGGLLAWLRRVLGKTNVERQSPSTD